jgi:hypothetical protein
MIEQYAVCGPVIVEGTDAQLEFADAHVGSQSNFRRGSMRLCLVVAVTNVGESREPLPVQVHLERRVVHAQGVYPHVELLPSHQVRVVDVPLRRD